MIKRRSVGEVRPQAEEQLLKKKQNMSAPATTDELHRLVQELEVHQIELEMQNKELQQIRSELEVYLTKYTDLYDFAPVGYFTLDKNGVILGVNLNGTRMFRIERSVILNQRFEKFISNEYRPAFSAFLEKVFRNRTQETIEIVLQIEGGKELYTHLEAMVSENSRECRVALMDITAQKKLEQKMQESEQKYRSLYENMSQGVLYQESNGEINRKLPNNRYGHYAPHRY